MSTRSSGGVCSSNAASFGTAKGEFESQIVQLSIMGFSVEAAERALQATAGCLHSAVEVLLRGE